MVNKDETIKSYCVKFPFHNKNQAFLSDQMSYIKSEGLKFAKIRIFQKSNFILFL